MDRLSSRLCYPACREHIGFVIHDPINNTNDRGLHAINSTSMEKGQEEHNIESAARSGCITDDSVSRKWRNRYD